MSKGGWHDVIEDASVTADDLRDAGIKEEACDGTACALTDANGAGLAFLDDSI